MDSQPILSSMLDWKLTGERYNLIGLIADIDAAKTILKTFPHPVVQIKIMGFKEHLARPRKTINEKGQMVETYSIFHAINWEKLIQVSRQLLPV